MDSRDGWMAEVYESNSSVVYRVCQRLLKNSDDAADAMQEVFVRAFVSLKSDTESEKARAWLITVARNHCQDVLRRKLRLAKAVTRLGAEPVWHSEAECAVVDRNFVQAVLGQLRERERQALWQSAVEYRPIGEIGRYFGLSYVAAAQLLHRARRRASTVAARLAAIFGVLQLNRLGKRPAFGPAIYPLAVALVVPVVVAGVVGAGSPPQATTPAFASPAVVLAGSPAKMAALPSSASPSSAVRKVQSTVNALTSGALPAPSQLLPFAVPVPAPPGVIQRLLLDRK
jgi:RNA polymerase sigma factor (sigma-70 family)